ncbi:hypothetical protein [Rubinisphaera sp.]|uniref:hypothetical protein n=1 Tax=Rubinisphaera sp. TaxID=2024857 RepID=UPI000C112249|nr:hypothetical protein [Rubinisphaera sp.]MBV11006.1 hypothetical protein [Rubinisphaera sp.]HCS53647.1 hypothetical protein [Planctomycetaceae bacterium]|tara:strand:- start:13911 stop:14426 length:516 start_codon:yes stop_codon:yes gene_type:complete
MSINRRIKSNRILRTINRGLAWAIGIPAAWLVVTSSYHLQQGWSEIEFLIRYLLLYAALATGSMIVRTPNSELPSVTFWCVCVFPLVGLARLAGLLLHSEYATGVEPSFTGTLLAMTLGSVSLFVFMKWEERKDRQTMGPYRDKNSDIRYVTLQNVSTASQLPMQEEANLW